MTLSASSCLLVAVSAFALFCHVQAGFCTDIDSDGNFCRYNPTEKEYSSLCVCKTKCKTKKKKKRRFLKSSSSSSKKSASSFSCKADCEKKASTPCVNGCNFGGNEDWYGTGRCYVPSTMCASTPLNELQYKDGTATKKLTEECPEVVKTTYNTWKNRVNNIDAQELAFATKMVLMNADFSKAKLLPKFYKPTAKGIDTIEAAWTTNCQEADVKSMNCFAFFPKCKKTTFAVASEYVSGALAYQSTAYSQDNSLCQAPCAKVQACIKAVEDACTKANPDDAAQCPKYSTFGPLKGSTLCKDLCGHQQNDYVAAGSTTAASFVTIAIGLVTAFM